MKELIENLFWIIVIVLGSLYLIFIEVENYRNRIKLKLRIKYTEDDIVNMKIINKVFSKGEMIRVGGDIIPSKLPATYTVKLEYEGNEYEINDKEIFDSFDVGQTINLKLVRNLDENKNLITYELFKIS